MPLVRIDMVQGRSTEQIADLIESVSDAVSQSLGAPLETVRVFVTEIPADRYGIGGKPFPVVQRERAQQNSSN